MQIENSFEVPASTDAVWDYMLDIEKVVPCMPGASLTETIDETHWKGKLTVKVGPVSLNFSGKVAMTERDDDAHRVVLEASGMEQRGKGAASATVTSSLESYEGGTRVLVVQDLKISGQAAQFSRGMMQDVSAKLTKRFADCLEANMSIDDEAANEAGAAGAAPIPAPGATQQEGETVSGSPSSSRPASAGAGSAKPQPSAPAAPRPRVEAKPVGGIGLALGALFSAIVRFFKKLFGRSKG